MSNERIKVTRIYYMRCTLTVAFKEVGLTCLLLIRGSTPPSAFSFATHLAVARSISILVVRALELLVLRLAWLEGRRGNLERPFSAEAIATLASSLTS